jgi:ABC-type dipeptide/oligopeptide/nickel transport system permease component
MSLGMAFLARRLLAAVVLVAIVPSLTYVYFAATYAGGPVLPGLRDYLEAVFLRFELDGALGGGPRSDVYYLLREGVPVDLALMGGGLALGIGLGALGGLYLAERRAGTVTVALHVAGVVAICAPAAVTAYALVFFFGSTGGSNPVFFVSDAGVYTSLLEDPLRWAQGLWVPWVAVALPIAGAVMRVSAGAARDALSEDSVRTAYAKGLTRGRVLRRHVLIYAVAPISAYGGAAMNLVILNSAIVQEIFNLPGSFRYARDAVENPNVGLLQTMALVTVLYVVIGNLIADLATAWADPRVRRSAAASHRGVLRRPAARGRARR